MSLPSYEKGEMDLKMLICEIFTRQCLWNTCDKNYHNRILVDRMWAEISDKIKFPIDECKRKWKNLRDRFRIEMRKDVSNKSGTLISNWPYYYQLQFLKAVMGPSKSSGNLSEIDHKIDNNVSTEKQNNNPEYFEVQREIPSIIQNYRESDNLHSLSSIKCHRTKAKRKQIKKQKISTKNTKSMLLAHLENILMAESKESEDLLFFKSLLGYMETFSPLQKLRVRNRITNVIMSELSSNSRIPTPESGSQNFEADVL